MLASGLVQAGSCLSTNTTSRELCFQESHAQLFMSSESLPKQQLQTAVEVAGWVRLCRALWSSLGPAGSMNDSVRAFLSSSSAQRA